MSDNIHDRKFLVYHQGRRSFLNVYRSTVATQDFLFIDPNCRCRKLDLGNRIVRGEEQNTSPGARCRKRVSNESRMRYGHQHGIGSPPLGLGLYCIYKLTICWVKGLYRAKGEAFGTSLTMVLMGSMKVASSKVTSSGSAMMPRSATQGMALTYSPKPPPLGVKPPVSPVVLYCLHCE